MMGQNNQSLRRDTAKVSYTHSQQERPILSRKKNPQSQPAAAPNPGEEESAPNPSQQDYPILARRKERPTMARSQKDGHHHARPTSVVACAAKSLKLIA